MNPTIKTSHGQAGVGKITTKDNSKYSKCEYYLTNFKIEKNMFQRKVNIGIDPNENKHLYDITKIKRIDQNHSTSAKAFTTSLVNSRGNANTLQSGTNIASATDNIPQSNTKVNSDTSS